MTLGLRAVLAGLFALPTGAMALPPCVGADLATPLPQASAVEVGTADIPTARFSGIWQQGQLNGFAYRIFPDLTAMVFDSKAKTGWRIDLRCTTDASCTQTIVGTVPEAAKPVASLIGRCLIPETPKPVLPKADFPAKEGPVKQALAAVPPPPAVPAAKVEKDPAAKPAPPPAMAEKKPSATPKPEAAKPASPTQAKATPSPATAEKKPAVTPKPEAAKPSSPNQPPADSKKPDILPPQPPKFTAGPKASHLCAAPSPQDAGSTIRAIQRLLKEAGANPGRIDGILGKRTKEALLETLGPDIAQQTPLAILMVLVAKSCSD
jgi:hypothetical protein